MPPQGLENTGPPNTGSAMALPARLQRPDARGRALQNGAAAGSGMKVKGFQP